MVRDLDHAADANACDAIVAGLALRAAVPCIGTGTGTGIGTGTGVGTGTGIDIGTGLREALRWSKPGG